jgi:hypothetical protein
MRLTRWLPLAAALSCLLSGPAFAQTASTLAVKNGAGSTVNIAGQTDSSTNFHYRDVMEGLDSSGNPWGVNVDPSSRDLVIFNLGSPFQAGGSIGNTVFGATESGTWNLNNISGTVSLPTGAATSALQSATQAAAGSSSSSATGVQGVSGGVAVGVSGSVTANAGTNLNTSALALDASVNGIIVAQGSTTTGEKGGLTLGAVTTSSPTYTSGQSSAFSLDTLGALRVNVIEGGGTGGTSSTFGSTFPTTGTAAGFLNSGGTAMAAANLDASGNLKVDVAAGSAANAAASATGSAVPASAGYTGLNFGGNLKGWTGDTNGYGDVNVENSVAVTGTFWQATQPISAASLPLPSGAATAAGLTTINTTLGSPFQAGGSIGNTSFGISGTLPAFASTPTVNAAESGTWNVTNISGSVSLPTGAATAALQSATQAAAGSSSSAATGVQGVSGGVPVGVSGTVTANAGSGTFAVSASALPLPTGAATSANQSSQITQETASATALGTPADTAWTGSGSGTIPAILKKVDADVQGGSGTIGATAPTTAIYNGAYSSGNLVGLVQADQTPAINISTAGTTQLVAAVSGKRVLVTHWNVMAGGTVNATWEYGTGTNCGTGTTLLTGAYPLTAQNGAGFGSGLGPILIAPAGNALCMVTSAAVQVSGGFAFTQEP